MKGVVYFLLIYVCFTLSLPYLAVNVHDCGKNKTTATLSKEKMPCHGHEHTENEEKEEQGKCNCPPFCSSCVGCIATYVFFSASTYSKNIQWKIVNTKPQIEAQLFAQTYINLIWQPPKMV